MAHDVFVSHSVKDKAIAEKIVAKLEAESIGCWVAPRDVIPGADWGESIINAIESSRVMILIFSRNANGSPQIKREVERAVNKEVYTIPFRVEDIEPSKALEYFISTSQWMDAFTPPLEQHLDKLAQTVKAILVRLPVVAAEANKPGPVRRDETPAQARNSAPSSLVWLKPVAVVAGLMILSAVIWYSLSQKRARLWEEKSKNAAVADTSLLTPSPTTVSPPAILNAAVDSARKSAEQPEVPAKTEIVPPARKNLPAESIPQNDDARDLDATTWNHNGSTVVLKTDGSRISLVYQRVRPGLQGIVPDGATLFEGVVVGNRYSGRARHFKRNFRTIEYEVSGGTLDGGKVIQLQGNAPTRGDNGIITGSKLETLRFEYVGSAK